MCSLLQQKKTSKTPTFWAYCSKAPCRIDFSGGWTDILPLTKIGIVGAVVNAAINLYTYVTIREKEHEGVTIHSFDFPKNSVQYEIQNPKRMRYDGNFDLVKAALRIFQIPCGLSIEIRNLAPIGSGLGTSASMGVSLVGALSRCIGKRLSKEEIADIAQNLERELSVPSGKQDHYSSAIGGINFMEFHGEYVKLEKLDISDSIQDELKRRMVLCYTQKSRFASNVLQSVVDAYFNGKKSTREAISSLRNIAYDMKAALLEGNLESFGKLMEKNWLSQKRLHPSITNAQIDSLFDIAYSSGAIGGKACGAGGGGCLVFFCL